MAMARQWSVLLLLLGVSLAFAASEVHEASVREVRRLDDIDAAPPPEESATSILMNLWDNIALQLHSPERQWLHALIAFIFGIPLLFDCMSSLDLVITATGALLACVLTQSEASSIWHMDHTDPLALFMGIQAAVLCAWALYKGIEGVRPVCIALLGVSVAMVAQAPLVSLGAHQLRDQKWSIAAYYSLFCWFGLWMYMKNKFLHIFAVVCALIGGALVTSAGAWAITFSTLRNAAQSHGVTDLHPVGGDWVDFFFMLFTRDAKDLGVFAGSSDIHNEDVIADRIVWFLLAAVGISFQFSRMERKAAGPATAREGLRQKLLVAEV